jgi:hypothetical protein
MKLTKKLSYGFKPKEFDLAYSCFKIIPEATTPFSVINNLSVVTPIGFDGDFMDKSQITAASNGALTRLSTFPDQAGNFPTLINAHGNALVATDSSGDALDYLNDPDQEGGMYFNTTFPNLQMSNDYIVWYVMRNETQINNQRANFHIRTGTGASNGSGLTVAMYPSGNNYAIGVIHNAPPTNSSFSEIRFLVNRLANVSNFWLFTFAKIGGVLKMYINNVEQTGDTTNELVFGYASGIYIGVRDSSSGAGGKINDFQSLIMKRGRDLSNYNLSRKNIELMQLHGIS